MTLLDKVAILCRQREMTIRQLEKEAGLKDRTIQHWDKSVPGADKVVKVANVLQVPMEELFSVYDESGNMLRVSKIISECGEASANDITEREKGILLCFRLLNAECGEASANDITERENCFLQKMKNPGVPELSRIPGFFLVEISGIEPLTS